MSEPSIQDVLAFGELTVEGRLAGSSNATLKVSSAWQGVIVDAVYKPRRGERPLWDFPQGSLGHREVAMSILDTALGWRLVPTTVWREEGPFGPGSCQLWIDPDPDAEAVTVVPEDEVPEGWLAIAQGEDESGGLVVLAHADTPDLRRVALLDVIANNADRKGGHVLVTGSGGIAAIDHGIAFHVEDKLRTVLWGWAGQPLAEDELRDIMLFADTLDERADDLRAHLTGPECEALRERVDGLLVEAAFPVPSGGWPALPWPAM